MAPLVADAGATARYSSARDFRSDTVTTPTPEMLSAMASASFGDDVYSEDETTSNFEKHVAQLLGHEAGIFVSSGTMSNQLGLRTHLLQPPHSVLCDHRAHVKNYEAGGLAALSQAMVIGVTPSNGVYLTLEDVEEHAILGDEIHSAPTTVISLENTIGGSIMPLSEVRRISAWARENGIKMHLDGARLWNAVAAGAGTLEEYGREFDSVSVCFSKGLGAPIGSVLVASPASFISRARHLRKMLGGGMRQTGLLTGAARVALEMNYPGHIARTHQVAKRIEEELVRMGLKMIIPVDTSILFVDLMSAGIRNEWLVEECSKRDVRLGSGGRIVVHYQIEESAVEALIEVYRVVLKRIADGELVAETGSKPRVGYGPATNAKK
ncbi:hypothetical protein DL93DRAFT_2089218 [Clavulina sp. PMI_390]|nr:hypothetical protein DL93DRAFT_2089218 [Clavulina sp. PMI_390]